MWKWSDVLLTWKVWYYWYYGFKTGLCMKMFVWNSHTLAPIPCLATVAISNLHLRLFCPVKSVRLWEARQADGRSVGVFNCVIGRQWRHSAITIVPTIMQFLCKPDFSCIIHALFLKNFFKHPVWCMKLFWK